VLVFGDVLDGAEETAAFDLILPSGRDATVDDEIEPELMDRKYKQLQLQAGLWLVFISPASWKFDATAECMETLGQSTDGARKCNFCRSSCKNQRAGCASVAAAG